jgi:hypothetical protein
LDQNQVDEEKDQGGLYTLFPSFSS